MGKDTRGREALVRLIINQRTRRERERTESMENWGRWCQLVWKQERRLQVFNSIWWKKSHCIFSSLENLTASFSCWSKRMEGEKKDRIQEKEWERRQKERGERERKKKKGDKRKGKFHVTCTCHTEVFHKCVARICFTWLFRKTVSQECHARVIHECFTRVSSKGVLQKCFPKSY